MRDSPPLPLPVCRRRFGRRMAYQNGAVWAVGNGLASSTLVVYLALELGAPGAGLAVSLILAAPQIAGLLRLAAPRLIRWFGSRKRFCLASYALSLAVLALLPACVAVRIEESGPTPAASPRGGDRFLSG